MYTEFIQKGQIEYKIINNQNRAHAINDDI